MLWAWKWLDVSLTVTPVISEMIRQALCGKFRVRVDAGAHSCAPQGHLGQLLLGVGYPNQAEFDLAGVSRELLAKSDGSGVL